MEVSKKIEYFMNMFCNARNNLLYQSDKVKNENLSSILKAYTSLQIYIIDAIQNRIKEQVIEEYNNFHDNIYNYIVNKQNQVTVSEDQKEHYKCADRLSDNSKKIINYYLDIVIDQNYDFKFDQDTKKTNIHISNLLMPIWCKWKKDNSSEYFEALDNYGTIVENLGSKLTPISNYHNTLKVISNIVLDDEIQGIPDFLYDLAKESKSINKL